MPDDRSPHILVTVGGAEHPIHMDEISARQVAAVQEAFGINPAAFEVMIKTEVAAQEASGAVGSVVGLPQLCALVFLSQLQVARETGEKVDPEPLWDAITLGTDTEIRLMRSFTRAEVAVLDPPA